MIAHLKGSVKKKMDKSVILTSGDIGYLVHLPLPLLEKISTDDPLELFIHTKVQEDDISLYGFENYGTLEFFKSLISISGIGAKIALEILSTDPDKVKTAILQQDAAYLSKIPGIGKKTAERIIVELKNKVEITGSIENPLRLSPEINEDVIHALQNLGYKNFEIKRVLEHIPEDKKEPEEIISYFLQNV